MSVGKVKRYGRKNVLSSRVRTEKEHILNDRKQRKGEKKEQRVVNNNVKGRGETK